MRGINVRYLEIDDCSKCSYLYDKVCHNPEHPVNYIVGKQIKIVNDYGRIFWRIPEECKLKRS